MQVLSTETEHIANIVIMHVVGEVDMTSAPAFADDLVAAEHDAQAVGAPIIVDLGAVTFFGSSGVAALAAFQATCNANGMVVRVVPTPAIRHLLTITGVDESLVNTAKSVGAALAELRSSR